MEENPYEAPKTACSGTQQAVLTRLLYALLAFALAGMLPLILLFGVVVVAISIEEFTTSPVKGIATAASGTAIFTVCGVTLLWTIQGSLRKAFGTVRRGL